MPGNSIGKLFKLTTFGESHGEAIGGILDGCPAGLELNLELVQKDLDKRRPGQSAIVTQRKEPDTVKFLSGIFEGRTTGAPIGFQIENTNQKSKDYSHNQDAYRPSHADFTYDQKYGFRDHRGGGRSSARETACRVVAGSIAKQLLPEIKITAYTASVGEIQLKKKFTELDFSLIESNPVRCPDPDIAKEMEAFIKDIRSQGDTVGGVVECLIQNVPMGLGEPVFDKLHAELGKAMLSINAVKGFEYGSGFEGTALKGSQHNDLFNPDGSTQTNRSGGIQGGISNGMDIYFSLINRSKKKVERGKIRFDKSIADLQKERSKLQKTTTSLKTKEQKAEEQKKKMEETNVKIQQKLEGFQELFDSNQRLIYLGNKINDLSEKYFNNKRKKELIEEFLKIVEIENSKRKKLTVKEKKAEKTKEVKIKAEAEKKVVEIRQIKKEKQEKEKIVEEAKPKMALKIGDRVRMEDGKAVGSIDSIEKGTAKVNYGIFTTTVSVDKLELVQRMK